MGGGSSGPGTDRGTNVDNSVGNAYSGPGGTSDGGSITNASNGLIDFFSGTCLVSLNPRKKSVHIYDLIFHDRERRKRRSSEQQKWRNRARKKGANSGKAEVRSIHQLAAGLKESYYF